MPKAQDRLWKTLGGEKTWCMLLPEKNSEWMKWTKGCERVSEDNLCRSHRKIFPGGFGKEEENKIKPNAFYAHAIFRKLETSSIYGSVIISD